MGIVGTIPALLWVLLAYLGVIYLGDGAQTLNRELFSFLLISGAPVYITVNGLLVLVGLVMLFFEVLKATRISNITVVDHMLSTFVFIGYLLAFLMIPAAGNQFFLMLVVMSLIDVMAGFSVSITGARRDIGLNEKNLG